MNRSCLRTVLGVILSVFLSNAAVGEDDLDRLVGTFYNSLPEKDGDAYGYASSRAIAEEMLSLGEQENSDSLRVRGLIRLVYIEFLFGKRQNDFAKKLDRCEVLLKGLSDDIAVAEFYMFRGHILAMWQKNIPGGIKKSRGQFLWRNSYEPMKFWLAAIALCLSSTGAQTTPKECSKMPSGPT